MLRTGVILVALAAVAGISGTALGQSSTTDGTPVLGNSASQNLRSFRQRAPGSWVQLAIRRHNGEDVAPANSTTGNSGTNTSTGSGGISDLINSVLGSGLLGGTNIGGLLGGTTNTTNAGSGTTNTSTGTATTGGDRPSGIPSNVPQSVIDQIIAAGIDPNTIFAKSLDDPVIDAADDASANAGSSNTQIKQSVREQTTTPTSQPAFRTRLLNTLMQTFFTALTVGFQSQDFIDALKDGLRPLIRPQAASSDGGNGSSDGSGGGIEDGGTGDGSEPNSPI